jgi:hypothetical protein
MIDPNAVLARAAEAHPEFGAQPSGEEPSEDVVRQAMAGLAAHQPPPDPQQSGELKYKLTMLLFPAILLVFVALYVASLASGVDPEVGLFRAGGASLMLAILARVAIGIIGDDTRLVLNDGQIVAMARSGSVRDYLAASAGDSGTDQDSAGAEQPFTTAQAAGTGGKE